MEHSAPQHDTTTAHPARRVALALRHVAFEDAGSWARVLHSEGYEVRYLRAGVDALDAQALSDADLLLVLGGPIGVHDHDLYPFLEDHMRSIAAWVSLGEPILGICLGAQMIAAALGAHVRPGAAAEFGFQPVDLTAAGRSSVLSPLEGIPVLHWHRDMFDIPDESVSLARTAVCASQAFAIGDHVLALQFHPEVDGSRIEEWLIGHAVELAANGIDPRDIRRDAQRYGERLRAASAQMLTTWLRRLPKT